MSRAIVQSTLCLPTLMSSSAIQHILYMFVTFYFNFQFLMAYIWDTNLVFTVSADFLASKYSLLPEGIVLNTKLGEIFFQSFLGLNGFELISTFKYIISMVLAQDCSNSIADAMELLQSCTKPSICMPSLKCPRLHCNEVFVCQSSLTITVVQVTTNIYLLCFLHQGIKTPINL